MDAILGAEMDYRTTRNLCNTSMWHFFGVSERNNGGPEKETCTGKLE